MQIKERANASLSLWEAISTGPDAAGGMPTGRHAAHLHKFLLGTFVWERGLLQLILCLRKEIVKTLPAGERREWKSGGGNTLSTCKEQWFNETAGWSMMELDRIPKRKWRETEEAKENCKSTLFKFRSWMTFDPMGGDLHSENEIKGIQVVPSEPHW